jgi:hypothetical protein
MNSQEKADFIREKYSRFDYLLLTLVSSSLLLSKVLEDLDSPPAELRIVEEALRLLRDDLSESETLAVATLMSEIEMLGSDDDAAVTKRSGS